MRALFLDLNVDKRVDATMGAVGISRVRSRHDCLILRPFPLWPFQRGMPDGPKLLLQKLRGAIGNLQLSMVSIGLCVGPRKKCFTSGKLRLGHELCEARCVASGQPSTWHAEKLPGQVFMSHIGLPHLWFGQGKPQDDKATPEGAALTATDH